MSDEPTNPVPTRTTTRNYFAQADAAQALMPNPYHWPAGLVAALGGTVDDEGNLIVTDLVDNEHTRAQAAMRIQRDVHQDVVIYALPDNEQTRAQAAHRVAHVAAQIASAAERDARGDTVI